MKYYLKLNEDIIIDVITYPFGDYIEVEIDEETLPAGINGGWYHWDGTQYIFDEELWIAIHPEKEEEEKEE